MTADPRLIVTIGLHGSASTWVFNVARELMLARHGADRVASRFAKGTADLLVKPGLAGRHIIWKTHDGGREWENLRWLAQPIIVLSIRDPRDAAMSLVQRFGMKLGAAVQAIGQDCRRAVQCADEACLVLRYEDRFFDDPATVTRLMQLTGPTVPDDVRRRIFETYRTGAVRDFAAAMVAREHDPVTQIHRTHIGDGRVGKWCDLLGPRQQAEIGRRFMPFLSRFGYPL